jgi:hypothetical protein
LLLQVIELPLKHPELFESLGIAQPKVGSGAAKEQQQRQQDRTCTCCAQYGEGSGSWAEI